MIAAAAGRTEEDIHAGLFPHPQLWMLLGALMLAAALWAALSGFSIRFLPEGSGMAAAALKLALPPGLFALGWALRRRMPNLARAIQGLVFFHFFALTGMTLNYLGARAAMPLVDPALHAADAALGFDWLAYVRWLNARSGLVEMFATAYRSLPFGMLLAFLWLAAKGEARRMREYLFLVVVTLLIVDVFSVVAPATGAVGYLKPGADAIGNLPEWAGRVWLGDLQALREGRMHAATWGEMQGIVAFPSFHAIGALLPLWGLRGAAGGWLFRLLLPVNAIMLAATIPMGGHYLVDLLGGAAALAFAIVLHRVWERHLGQRPARGEAPVPVMQGS